MIRRRALAIGATLALAAGCAGVSTPPSQVPASAGRTDTAASGPVDTGGPEQASEGPEPVPQPQPAPGGGGSGDGDGGDGSSAIGGPTVLVVEVIDGDTITVRTGGREVDVRLIGIDTPETVHPTVGVECFGPEASAFTHARLEGRRVSLEYDVERRDRYGRDLAYVWRGRMFNEILVRRGFATAYPYPPNTRYAQRFAAAERLARGRDAGLWKACAGRDGASGGTGAAPSGGGGGGGNLRCDPSYPGVCIPPPPPDLDCGDIDERNFRVEGDDPHAFDGNGDGRGCES